MSMAERRSVAFLGRLQWLAAGGDSMSNTAPESREPLVVAGSGGAGLSPAGADAGEGRE